MDAAFHTYIRCLTKLFGAMNEIQRLQGLPDAADRPSPNMMNEFGQILVSLPFEIRATFETLYKSKFMEVFGKHSAEYFKAEQEGTEQANNYILGARTPRFDYTNSIYANFASKYNRILQTTGVEQNAGVRELQNYIREKIAVFQQEFPDVNLGPIVGTGPGQIAPAQIAPQPPPAVLPAAPAAPTSAEHSMGSTLKISSIHKLGRLKI